MRTILLALLLTACAGGDTDETDADTDFPDVCRFVTGADLFDFGAVAAGESITGDLDLEMRCPEATGLSLAWEEPAPAAFSFEGPAERTLEPYTVTPLSVTFAPPAAGAYEARLTLIPADPGAGGVIVRFRGTGQ